LQHKHQHQWWTSTSIGIKNVDVNVQPHFGSWELDVMLGAPVCFQCHNLTHGQRRTAQESEEKVRAARAEHTAVL